MNNNKICFISCVNDDVQYNECLKYINNLYIPEGLEVEIKAVKEAVSICHGYNEAMRSCDAKYKVYLHQDTFIINKDFISDILKIFNGSEKVGMLGVCGAKTIPTNAVWWDSTHKYGKVYENHTGNMELLAFNEVYIDYENVKAIDGLIMVTQYDLPWREDIFDGWHFYDVAQSVEFAKAGYNVVVPNQYKPWCIHDCGIVATNNNYEVYKDRFLSEYSKMLFPLVSVLIPAYNRKKYLALALESVIKQTYKNIEIVICDDSTNDEIKKLMMDYIKVYDNIKYFYNGGPLGQKGLLNAQKCLDMCSGEYISYLMDDDLFHTNKIATMINFFNEYNDITLVTSFRQTIDKDGEEIETTITKNKLFNETKIISGNELIKFMLKNVVNYIGEPTTAIIKKIDIDNKFGTYNSRQYRGLVDMAMWLKVLEKGNAVYISEPLSYFRIHEGQNQNNLSLIITCINEWFYLIEDFYKDNSSEDYKQSLINCIKNNLYILNLIENSHIKLEGIEELFNNFCNAFKRVMIS